MTNNQLLIGLLVLGVVGVGVYLATRPPATPAPVDPAQQIAAGVASLIGGIVGAAT